MRWVGWLVAVGLAVPGGAGAQDVHLKIIGINDLHGNLESPGSFRANAQSPEVPVGGADYVAGYIASLKRENPLNVVVSAGDLTGGSPLVSAFFHDEDTVEAANLMGLDLNGVGNHEFDQGKQELLRKQYGGCWGQGPGDGCKGAAGARGDVFRGAKFEYLAANVFDTSTGKTIFPGYAIRTYGGVRVAFVGVTLKDTPTISQPSTVAGLRFADEAETINAIVERLHRQRIRIFVVLIHQGGYQKGSEDAVDINGCEGGLQGSPIEAIVNRLDDGVNLVLSAHTHAAYVCEIADRVGRRIPVTSASAYGRVVTDIDMTIDTKTGRAMKITAKNVLVDRTNADIQPDGAVKALVDRYSARAAPLANRVVGTVGAEITKLEGASGESEMGELIADAELEATHAAADGGAVMAFTNIGGVRAGLAYDSALPGNEAGKVTYNELFTALPFGNNLVTMTLTGAQIKTMLEEQFKGCGESDTDVPITLRWLEVPAGFSYSWNANGGVCAKVDAGSIELNGAVFEPAAKYRVTVNSLLADGGEQFPVLRHGTDRRTGVRDVDAMEMYFAKHPAVLPPHEPRVRQQP